ncbi:hypothetical protein CIC12_07790 [Burkholderia sp. SG-MS1]|nr:hypothetical protein [Paraburkholderia sp. SG-MS1]
MDPLIDSLMLKLRHNRVYTASTLARLFGVSEKAVEAALATPLVPRRFDGALAGYDGRLREHRSLAMLVRR